MQSTDQGVNNQCCVAGILSRLAACTKLVQLQRLVQATCGSQWWQFMRKSLRDRLAELCNLPPPPRSLGRSPGKLQAPTGHSGGSTDSRPPESNLLLQSLQNTGDSCRSTGELELCWYSFLLVLLPVFT